ncbi:MAG: succinate dehydrogenase [Chlamydiales bacterium]|nr:succinate dehydrogenase [Chlamydiales bacterium]
MLKHFFLSQNVLELFKILGVKYLFTSRSNFSKSNGEAPSIRTPRNRAYSWQRITSWILLVTLIAHVVKFRFLEYPDQVEVSGKNSYLVAVSLDEGLYTLADRLCVQLYGQEAIDRMEKKMQERSSEEALVEAAKTFQQQEYDWVEGPLPQEYNSQTAIVLSSVQNYLEDLHFVDVLKSYNLLPRTVVAVCNDFGTASLLSVRNTFQSPVYAVLYTVFVLAACFHAFNGLWTFLITWGMVLKMTAQRTWTTVAVIIMLGIIFLGLASIWGTYWFNLKY